MGSDGTAQSRVGSRHESAQTSLAGRQVRLWWMAITAVFLVLTVSAGLSVFSAAADADTVFRVHTWNMAQGNSKYQQYFTSNILIIVDYVHTYPAWQLSTQETCRTQADQIVWYANANGAGYTMKFGPSTPTGTLSGNCADPGGGANRGPYGNAVFAIGPAVAPDSGGRWFYYNSKPTNEAEMRNAVCYSAQNFGFRYMACSTHLTAPGGQWSALYPLAEMDEAHTRTQNWIAGEGSFSVLAGDFNYAYNPPLINMRASFQGWWYTHDEAYLRGGSDTSWRQTIVDGAARMIDFEWADFALFPTVGPVSMYLL